MKNSFSVLFTAYYEFFSDRCILAQTLLFNKEQGHTFEKSLQNHEINRN